MKLLAIVVPFIVYFLGGWIVKDIYFSIYPITGDTTIQYICRSEITIFAIVSAVYNVLILCKKNGEVDKFFFIGLLVPFASWMLAAHILPISEGAALLNAILCIGSMIYIGFYAAEK